MLADASRDLVFAVTTQDGIVTGSWVDHIVIASCHNTIAGLNPGQKAIGEGRMAVVADKHIAVRSTGDEVPAGAAQYGVVAAASKNVISIAQVRRSEIWVHRRRSDSRGDVFEHTRSACGMEFRSSVVAKDHVVTIGTARGQACRWIDVDRVGAHSADHDAAAASHIDYVVVPKRRIAGRDLREDTQVEHQIKGRTTIVSKNYVLTDSSRDLVFAVTT